SCACTFCFCIFFFFQAEDGIRDYKVTGVQTCALPICVMRRMSVSTGPIDTDILRIALLRVADAAASGASRFPAVMAVLRKDPPRSEERRVGKEWRSRGSPEHEKEKCE